MSRGKSRWGESEQQQPEKHSDYKPGWSRSRWGNPDPTPAEPPQRKITRPLPPEGAVGEVPEPGTSEDIEHRPTRLLQATPASPTPTKVSNQAEKVIFPAAPPVPADAFPLPRPPAAERKNPQRQQRSNAWLETLGQQSSKLRALPRRPRQKPLPHKANWLLRGLILFFSLLLALVIVTASVPGLRHAIQGLFVAASPPTTNTATQGTLVARSNVADSVLKLGNQPYQLSSAGQGIWSVTVSHLEQGGYFITISAPHYTPASSRVTIQAQHQSMVTAFLTVNRGLFTTLLSPSHNLITGHPLAAPVPTGAQYLGANTATQPLVVTIDYRVESLVDKPEPSVLASGSTVAPPLSLISGIIAPDILFTNAATGALVAESPLTGLPASHFLAALTITFDSTGQPYFMLDTPSVLKAIDAANQPISLPSGINADPALLFTLVHLSLDQGENSGAPTCLGLLDALSTTASRPDPEDGFFFGISGTTAHYFYRWGQLWTTNGAAHTLTPDVPPANETTLEQAQTLLDAAQKGQAVGCTG